MLTFCFALIEDSQDPRQKIWKSHAQLNDSRVLKSHLSSFCLDRVWIE